MTRNSTPAGITMNVLTSRAVSLTGVMSPYPVDVTLTAPKYSASSTPMRSPLLSRNPSRST
jgi:hypothetical protein